MKRSHYVLSPVLVFLFGFICFKDYKKPEAVLKKGTTVIIDITKDSIVAAADSRSLIFLPNNRFSYTDTTNKVFRINDFVGVFYGPESFGKLSLRDVVKRSYSSSLKFDKNCDVIISQLTGAVQDFFASMAPDQKQIFDAIDTKHLTIGLFIAGFERGKPIAAVLTATVRRDNGNYMVIAEEPSIRTNTYQVVSAGYDDHIRMDMINQKLSNKPTSIDDIIKWITVEGRNHPDVDSLVNYAVIKPKAFYWGRNYK